MIIWIELHCGRIFDNGLIILLGFETAVTFDFIPIALLFISGADAVDGVIHLFCKGDRLRELVAEIDDVRRCISRFEPANI